MSTHYVCFHGSIKNRVPDKALFLTQNQQHFSYFFKKKTCCGYSLEVPHQGTYNKYPQHMFLWRKKKNIVWIPPPIWSYLCFLTEKRQNLI